MTSYTIEFYKTNDRKRRVVYKIDETIFYDIAHAKGSVTLKAAIIEMIVWGYIKNILKWKIPVEQLEDKALKCNLELKYKRSNKIKH
jgi:hypothetical protein